MEAVLNLLFCSKEAGVLYYLSDDHTAAEAVETDLDRLSDDLLLLRLWRPTWIACLMIILLLRLWRPTWIACLMVILLLRLWRPTWIACLMIILLLRLWRPTWIACLMIYCC